jgi:Reverse transcriptase (RNA-dependent DNA polymerase)
MRARPQSTKLLVAMAAIFGFRISTHDVQQANLQSADKLMRDICISPSKEFELGSDAVLKLLKPLYDLCDSGVYWSKTLSDHLQNDFDMNSTTGDPAMFYQAVSDKIAGVTSTYDDDLLMAGTKEYEKETEMTCPASVNTTKFASQAPRSTRQKMGS